MKKQPIWVIHQENLNGDILDTCFGLIGYTDNDKAFEVRDTLEEKDPDHNYVVRLVCTYIVE